MSEKTSRPLMRIQGASDLILVNIREENLAEAQIRNLSSLLKYHFIDAEVKGIRVSLIIQ